MEHELLSLSPGNIVHAGRPVVRNICIRHATNDKKASRGGNDAQSNASSTDAQGRNGSQGNNGKDQHDGNPEALESAVADFTDSNIYTLGAVPNPQPSSPLRDSAAVDGESAEAEALLNASRSKGKASTSDAQIGKNGTAAPTNKPASSVHFKNLVANTTPVAASSGDNGSRPAATKAGVKAPPLPDKAGTDRAADVVSPSRRLLNLAGGALPTGRPEYRAKSPMSLARRRMISTYLPFKWQQELRKRAEDIPEHQFNYLLSTLVIITSALIGGMTAYAVWPFARDLVIHIFSADAVEARVLQVCSLAHGIAQYSAAVQLSALHPRHLHFDADWWYDGVRGVAVCS